jgi:hypothetical protein
MIITSLQDDEEASTLSLLLTFLILAGLAVGVFLIFKTIQDGGGLTQWATDLGFSITDGLIGAVSGSFSALFTGNKGILTSGKTIWNKSKLSPKNWFSF